MFEKTQILKQTGAKLYPYFVPSWNNCVRVAGFISSIMIVPVANYFLPTIFLGKDGESSDSNSKNNNTDFVTTLASASVVAVMYGLQKTLSAILTTSTMQVIRHENVQKLMGDSKFLIHGNCKDITSLQYTSVRDKRVV